MPGYKVIDKRRPFFNNAPAAAPIPGDLPAIRASELLDPIDKLSKYYSLHTKRELGESLRPVGFWIVIRGLMLSALQTHRAVRTLIADKQRPYTMPLQAEILVRSLFECLGNIMALGEDRKRLQIFLLDGYLNDFRRTAWRKKTHGGKTAEWDEWLRTYETQVLAVWAKKWRLTAEQASDPEKHIKEEWPTPGNLLREWYVRRTKTRMPAFLSASRADAYRYLYGAWYGHASALAHQRQESVKMAMFADNTDAQWYPGRVESNVAFDDVIAMACLFSELEHMTGFPARVDLRVLWERLQTTHDDAKAVYQLRYKDLLRME
jgi:hypothetical protein